MAFGYQCDRCYQRILPAPGMSKHWPAGVEIRARFMRQGRWEGRRWLHVCETCFRNMFEIGEAEKKGRQL